MTNFYHVRLEDAIVNEFAALALLSLANYVSCKRMICENNGLELLIRCLGSHNADLQKNCIDTISLLLQVA
jgi:Armadillo/beta-catenin-like repeat